MRAQCSRLYAILIYIARNSHPCTVRLSLHWRLGALEGYPYIRKLSDQARGRVGGCGVEAVKSAMTKGKETCREWLPPAAADRANRQRAQHIHPFIEHLIITHILVGQTADALHTLPINLITCKRRHHAMLKISRCHAKRFCAASYL
jgi:hypothetical protein